jgi:16S rRNA (guanine527-N7)-methyltransferase
MNVSRETLDIYQDLLCKWSRKINLVSAQTLKDAGSRHFDDFLQDAALCPVGAETWVDLGSGGGFPGAVVAMALKDRDLAVTLVESDQRKSAFLRTVSRETGVPFKVITGRIEEIEPLEADVVSARALAPLEVLLGFMERHAKPDGIGLFMKGSTWQSEVEIARKKWRFTLKAHTSVTHPDAAILEIGVLSRV